MNKYKDRKPYPIKSITADEFGYDKMQDLIRHYKHSNWRRRLDIIDELRNINHAHARDCIRSAAIHDQATVVRYIATCYARTLKIEKDGHPIALFKMRAIFRVIKQKNLVHNLTLAKQWLEKNGMDITTDALVSQYRKTQPGQYDFLYGRKITEPETNAFIIAFARSNGILGRAEKAAPLKAVDGEVTPAEASAE